MLLVSLESFSNFIDMEFWSCFPSWSVRATCMPNSCSVPSGIVISVMASKAIFELLLTVLVNWLVLMIWFLLMSTSRKSSSEMPSGYSMLSSQTLVEMRAMERSWRPVFFILNR